MDSNFLLDIFNQFPYLAIAISITVNIIVAILGVIPSFFVTLANILFFGYFPGLVISILGEAIGAVISFYLYRKGFKNISQTFLKNEKANKIINSETKDQIKLILAFRIFPYVPSGFVTYAAAISKINIYYFTMASTVGKIPSLVIESVIALGAVKVLQSGRIDLILALLSIIVVTIVVIQIFKKG